MIGLGVFNNQPANPYQPTLSNGIHLRWGFLRELGFPWYGFYLFRRPAQPGQSLCLSKVTGGLKKGNWAEKKYYCALGVLSSDTNLVLTDEFAPANQVEFALDGRNYLRFDLPEGEQARRIDLRVGFRAERCLDFGKLITLAPDVPSGSGPARPFVGPILPGPILPTPNLPAPPRGSPPTAGAILANPLNVRSVTFEVRNAEHRPAYNTRFDWVKTNSESITSQPLVGLGCEEGLTITLPAPSNDVEMLITRAPQVVRAGTQFTIEAFDSNNIKVATAQLQHAANRPETILLSGQNIIRIEVPSMRNTTYLHKVCSDTFRVEQGGVVKGTAFNGTTPVSTFTIDGLAGQIVIEDAPVTAIEIAPCAGSLIDLCYVPVAQGATQGWEKLSPTLLTSGVTYPIGLPVSQADYPCSVPNPQSLLTQRVRYALPPEWNATTFTELHDQLVELVKGGPTATPMDERIFNAPPAVSNPPDPNPPKLSTFYILDMLLLGSLHPALAQLLGLYWVDQTAVPDVAYDYLIVADHTGVGQLDPATVLASIQSSGFSQLDGCIVFNKRLTARSKLTAPSGVQTYELPGGAFPDAQGQLPQASNNAGLRWDVGWDNSGSLLPDHAVMYLVWRADLGNAAAPAPASSHDLVTKIPPDKAKPILVTEPRIPNGLIPERSPDWPPVPLHYIDRNLPDGWYSYEISGVDLFGRHSRNSSPAQILLRDKIPPPMPTAVKADALDPDDPYLRRDEAYDNWYNSLDSLVRETLIGLRVGWTWTPAHQQQAPDASEFRIYFHPGADLPPDRDQPLSWQDRYRVVAYDENVTIDSVSGDRVYEIFLPSPDADNLISVPLNPSLAEPVAYAHIGVSAADNKPHTADNRTSGDLSNRPGNEGFVGAVVKIYRVWRTPPAPPGDVFAGGRLYASPADYHNRSFFTYRWQPQPLLNLHVFRAMDDAIFKADWSHRPSATPLAESQLDLFPAGWNQATRQSVADELNQLDTFVPVEDHMAEAMAYYRQLSDGALRVLAGLPSSENAFVQLTINPLKPNDPANNNRLGPDNPDDLVLDPTQRAFIDTLDGRSTNCYFYRAAFVDDAHNAGPMGLSSPPVYLPNVVPPRAPVITKVLGGDREITIKWASNREADLAEYRIYRTDNEEDTRDVRLMTLVHTEPSPPADNTFTASGRAWTDTSIAALVTIYYRVVAVDEGGNASAPSMVAAARAHKTEPPAPPAWEMVSWIKENSARAVSLSWTSTEPNLICTLQRRTAGEGAWQSVSSPLAPTTPGTWKYIDHTATSDVPYEYRVFAQDEAGNTSVEFSPFLLAVALF